MVGISYLHCKNVFAIQFLTSYITQVLSFVLHTQKTMNKPRHA